LSLPDFELSTAIQIRTKDLAGAVFGDEVKVALFTDPCFFICIESAVFHLHAFGDYPLLLFKEFFISILVLAPDDEFVAFISLSKKMLGIFVFICNGQNLFQSGKGS